MNRFVLELSYKGTHYNGWQIQKNTSNTIQRVVNEKLSVIFREEVMVTASGRTDAGVHAAQNFAHFDANDLPKFFLRRINFLLPDDISVRNIFAVDPGFNARFDAVSRTYEYLVSYQKNPLLSDIVCYYPYPEIPVKKLNEAARVVLSHTDFAAFSKKRTQVKTTLCKIKKAHWKWDEEEQLLRFTIIADRFLRGMVRGVVATSIRYARDKITLHQFDHLLESKLPHKTDFSAPAQGLTLREVHYPANSLKPIAV